MRTYVLAESYAKFDSFIKEHKLNKSHFHYITGRNSLRGIRGTVLLVNRWWENDAYRNEGFLDELKLLYHTRLCSFVDVSWRDEFSVSNYYLNH